ncbi:MAG TPA: DUF4160 domain-containing protein [Rhizomicrobium sp.]|mgnify:CR=1 FL=1|nr:DUF4160 domain-containing protein [Rhizomicrobium sp.]
MVKVRDIGPYRVFFYSNEHEPEHVHIARDDSEVKIELFTGANGKPKLIYAVGMKRSDIRRAKKIVAENRDEFLEAWRAYFG